MRDKLGTYSCVLSINHNDYVMFLSFGELSILPEDGDITKFSVDYNQVTINIFHLRKKIILMLV